MCQQQNQTHPQASSESLWEWCSGRPRVQLYLSEQEEHWELGKRCRPDKKTDRHTG